MRRVICWLRGHVLRVSLVSRDEELAALGCERCGTMRTVG